MAPDRIELHNMCKRENESFKEYAQRWIDLAEDLGPLFESIIRCIPGPHIDKDGALQMLVSSC